MQERPSASGSTGWLDRIERLGNRLPDPATLFALGAVFVMLASALAVGLDWSVEKTVSRGGELVRENVTPTSLLGADGLYWILRSMVRSFVDFPPLGVVLVGMLGIGVAEKSGFIGALLKAMMLAVPRPLLTPTMVFVGVLSSMGLDAGYVVLPPVAAALYASVGRSPIAGLAAVFAGVSAGFGANLVVTSLDPLLAGLSTESARLLDPDYEVAATANLWFMIVSTFLLTGVGWAVTAAWVEPRFAGKPPEQGGPPRTAANDEAARSLSAPERGALAWAALALALGLGAVVAATWVEGAPLAGLDGPFPRWVAVIVPLLFLGFLVPGIVYGWRVGRIRSDRDVASMMSETMAGMGSYIVLAFFAAQFIAYFRHSGLGEMLALSGGQALASADLPPSLLMVGFVVVVIAANLMIGSMSAKYAFLAPVFVPMFMQVQISPELTQVAYRIGDSVSNVITPLNPYVVIVLVFMRRYVPSSGIGTLVALMLPYTVAYAVAWTALLIAWIALGLELGPAGPLDYSGVAAGLGAAAP
ncbi:MAG: AbgT family transporter [Myxococcota bacterium]